jgi:hypothetical protein
MITLDSLKHYDEKSKELISTKQNKLEGTNNQIVSFDKEGNVVVKDFSENAEKITYSNDKYNQFTNVNSVLDNLLEKVYYVKPVCTLISNKAGGTYEMGAVITAPIIFNWSVNKEIVTQTLTDCFLGSVTVREAIYDKNITEGACRARYCEITCRKNKDCIIKSHMVALSALVNVAKRTPISAEYIGAMACFNSFIIQR